MLVKVRAGASGATSALPSVARSEVETVHASVEGMALGLATMTVLKWVDAMARSLV